MEKQRLNLTSLENSNSATICLIPVLGQDRSKTRKIGLGLGLAGLVLCETRSCHARRHNLEGHNNFSSTIYSFSIPCLEHHYCGDQQWRSLA